MYCAELYVEETLFFLKDLNGTDRISMEVYKDSVVVWKVINLKWMKKIKIKATEKRIGLINGIK